MIVDELWLNGPKFIRGGGFPLGTDAVLLAAFAGGVRAHRACDLGCGTGVIALLLAWNSPSLIVDGIEIQAGAAETARKNAEINGLSDRMNIITGDLREYRSLLPAGETHRRHCILHRIRRVCNEKKVPCGEGLRCPVQISPPTDNPAVSSR